MLNRIDNFIPQFILTYLYHIEDNSHTYIVRYDNGTSEHIVTDRPMTVNDFNLMKQQYEYQTMNNSYAHYGSYGMSRRLEELAKNQENYTNYGLHNISA